MALGVVCQILRGRPLWAWRTGGVRIGRLRIPAAVGTAGILLLVSTANSYYAFITLLLIAVAGLAALLRSRGMRRFFGAVTAGVFVAATLVVSLIPSTLYSVINGANTSAVIRLPFEAELYGFKLTQLFLPSPLHRLSLLRALRSYYDSVYGNPAESPALGLVAAAGFLALLVGAVYLLVSIGSGHRPRHPELAAKLGALSCLTLICFLLGTVGGLGSVISFFTSDLRGWNRISIFIAILSLAAFGLQSMVDRIEAFTSPTAAILQLPYHPFPEQQSAQGVSETNQLRFYLHSHTLRWSGGGIKGRPSSEWVAAVERLSAPGVVASAVAAGFSGILIDTDDLSDASTSLAADLTTQLGAPPVSSADGRYLFFSLASAAATLHAGTAQAVLDRIGAVAVLPVVGQFLPRFDSYSGPQLLEPYNPRITLDNDRTETVRVRLQFVLTYSTGSATLVAALPDGTVKQLPATPAGVPSELEIDVPPGLSTVTFSVAEGAPISRSRWTPGPVVASGIEIVDVELARLLTEIEGGHRPAPVVNPG